jgi:hypothetical protein
MIRIGRRVGEGGGGEADRQVEMPDRLLNRYKKANKAWNQE